MMYFYQKHLSIVFMPIVLPDSVASTTLVLKLLWSMSQFASNPQGGRIE